jgi:hypothetical protein
MQEAVQVVVGGVPALPASRVDPEFKQYQIRRKLKVDANPFLYDHMIGEHPVLPATCAASWAAYSCEQLYPGYRFFSLEDYRVLKGIVFDDSLPEEHVLDLKEVAKSEEKIVFEALVWSKNKKGRTQYHYSLRVTLMKTPPVSPIFTPAVLSGGKKSLASPVSRMARCSMGRLFQGVESVLHISRGQDGHAVRAAADGPTVSRASSRYIPATRSFMMRSCSAC